MFSGAERARWLELADEGLSEVDATRVVLRERHERRLRAATRKAAGNILQIVRERRPDAPRWLIERLEELAELAEERRKRSETPPRVKT